MDLQIIRPEGWPRPKGYSQGWRVPAGRDLLFVAGQVGWDQNEQMVEGGFIPQFEQALHNCVAVVKAGGGEASDIVRFTIFCRDHLAYLENRREVGKAYRRVMGTHFPAMSLVEVRALIEDDGQVEIEATAAIQPANG